MALWRTVQVSGLVILPSLDGEFTTSSHPPSGQGSRLRAMIANGAGLSFELGPLRTYKSGFYPRAPLPRPRDGLLMRFRCET